MHIHTLSICTWVYMLTLFLPSFFFCMGGWLMLTPNISEQYLHIPWQLSLWGGWSIVRPKCLSLCKSRQGQGFSLCSRFAAARIQQSPAMSGCQMISKKIYWHLLTKALLYLGVHSTSRLKTLPASRLLWSLQPHCLLGSSRANGG